MHLFIYLSLFICKLHAMSVEAHACKSKARREIHARCIRTCGVKVVHTKCGCTDSMLTIVGRIYPFIS